MKKLFKILLFFFAFCLLPFYLQTQWIQQSVPVSKPITGIKFINANTGWAIADISTGGANYSYIMRTINGGSNWILQDSSFGASLLALSVVDNNIAYTGGFDGAATANLHKTTDGGVNWFVIPTPTNMSIFDLQFINQDSGWSCGSGIGADVRTTTNGGLNWIVRVNGIASQTLKIFFLNYNTGFCAANNTELYKTTNAGMNWISIYNSPELFFSMYFMNETTGWAGLAGGKVGYTTNGGTNWSVQQPFPLNSNNTTDIFFINQNTGYAGTGWFQKILKTTNSGVNWGYQVVPTGSVKIAVVDTSNAWAADIGISRTTNGGGLITYTGISNISTEIPTKFYLYQNYPNPFNPVTNIKYEIIKNSFVRMVIFDILGRTIANLVNENHRPGSYIVDWNAEKYPSGIYYYRLIADGKSIDTKKMILIK